MFPRSRRWRLDIPVEKGITVGKLCVCNRKLRIEFDCTFKTFDRLSQTFGGSTCRVVTSGGVKLSRFFVLSRLRIGSWNQYLRRDRSDSLGVALSFCGSRSRRHLRALALHRGMAEVAQHRFESRLAPQWIQLRFDAQPHNPRVPDRVRLQKQLQRAL